MAKKKKYTWKELEYFTNGSPIYPDDDAKVDRLRKEKEDYLRSLGATDEQIEEGDDLCPEEFWWNACDIIADLAQIILDERERKYDHWMNFVENIESETKQLKREIKKLNG